MTDNPKPLASLRRLRAVLALRGTTVAAVAKAIGVTPSHLRVVLLGRREASASLRSRLIGELRSEEWDFAIGNALVLQDLHSEVSNKNIPKGRRSTPPGPRPESNKMRKSARRPR